MVGIRRVVGRHRLLVWLDRISSSLIMFDGDGVGVEAGGLVYRSEGI